MLVYRLCFLMFFGSESGRLGFERIGMRSFAKNNFRTVGILMISRSIFFMILGGLGTNFHTFVALETGLKIVDWRLAC